MTPAKILIIEDDDSIADFLQVTLRSRGFEVAHVADGSQALRVFTEFSPDAVLLDLNLPGLEGTEILKHIRKNSETPVLVVSVRNDEVDKVCALELGADDYITKPFSARELVARIKTNLRTRPKVPSLFQWGDLSIDWKRAELFKAEVRVLLSSQEFALLQLLYENRDRVLTRSFLVERVWGYDYEGDDRVVDTTIKRLRRKTHAHLIETVRGRGYRLVSL